MIKKQAPMIKYLKHREKLRTIFLRITKALDSKERNTLSKLEVSIKDNLKKLLGGKCCSQRQKYIKKYCKNKNHMRQVPFGSGSGYYLLHGNTRDEVIRDIANIDAPLSEVNL